MSPVTRRRRPTVPSSRSEGSPPVLVRRETESYHGWLRGLAAERSVSPPHGMAVAGLFTRGKGKRSARLGGVGVPGVVMRHPSVRSPCQPHLALSVSAVRQAPSENGNLWSEPARPPNRIIQLVILTTPPDGRGVFLPENIVPS